MRIVFMGSPEFALPTLQQLLRANHELALVVTRPDRPSGRSRRLTPPPVAAFAREAGLPLYQPLRLRDAADLAPLVRVAPEIVVVAAFGLLLPRALLDLPAHGCLNVHPSLLPRHRGASPIEASILAGDDECGVSIILLTEEMDAGPILRQVGTRVGPEEDAPSLERRLAEIGARLLVECLQPWAAGRLVARPQDDSAASYCPRLRHDDAELDWTRPADELARRVRAFRGRADAYTFWDDRLLKVLEAVPLRDRPTDAEPGLVIGPDPSARPKQPLVAAGSGALRLRRVALAGRAAAAGEAFLNGYPAFIGARLGRKRSG